MSERDEIYLKHILENIDKVELSVEKVSKPEFEEESDLIDSAIRRVEVIGEAVKNLSSELRKKYPQIEWKKIAGTRDKLIHAYFKVDINLLWQIIEDDLIKLKKDIQEILKKMKRGKNAA